MVEYAQVIFMLFNDPELLKYYIQTWNVQDLFSTPVLGELRLHRFRRGDFIYLEGEPLRELYLLVRGQVKVFRTFNNGNVLRGRVLLRLRRARRGGAGGGPRARPSPCRRCGSATASASPWLLREELLRDYTFLAFIGPPPGREAGAA